MVSRGARSMAGCRCKAGLSSEDQWIYSETHLYDRLVMSRNPALHVLAVVLIAVVAGPEMGLALEDYCSAQHPGRGAVLPVPLGGAAQLVRLDGNRVHGQVACEVGPLLLLSFDRPGSCASSDSRSRSAWLHFHLPDRIGSGVYVSARVGKFGALSKNASLLLSKNASLLLSKTLRYSFRKRFAIWPNPAMICSRS